MTKNLALPALRRACNKMTQAKLADMIGVSTPTIVAIENGKRALTEDNSRKIMRATGAHWQSLISKASPVALDGEPYTQEHWERWRNSLRRPGRNNTHAEDVLSEILKCRFDTLLDSASACGRMFLLGEEFLLMCTRLSEDPGIKRCYQERVENAALPGDDLGQIMETYLADSAKELEFGLNIHQRCLRRIMLTYGVPRPVLKAAGSSSPT